MRVLALACLPLLVGGTSRTNAPTRTFSDLQQRLNRKTAVARHLTDYPAFIRVYDILFDAGEDVRALSWTERRQRLQAWFAAHPQTRLDLSPELEFRGWDELAEMRRRGAADARHVGAEQAHRRIAKIAGPSRRAVHRGQAAGATVPRQGGGAPGGQAAASLGRRGQWRERCALRHGQRAYRHGAGRCTYQGRVASSWTQGLQERKSNAGTQPYPFALLVETIENLVSYRWAAPAAANSG